VPTSLHNSGVVVGMWLSRDQSRAVPGIGAHFKDESLNNKSTLLFGIQTSYRSHFRINLMSRRWYILLVLHSCCMSVRRDIGHAWFACYRHVLLTRSYLDPSHRIWTVVNASSCSPSRRTTVSVGRWNLC